LVFPKRISCNGVEKETEEKDVWMILYVLM
jgi:hypothetical protein